MGVKNQNIPSVRPKENRLMLWSQIIYGHRTASISPKIVRFYGARPAAGRIVGFFIIFSSPEHEVLMVSYCGQWLSVVRRRPSSVVCRASTFDVYTLETTFVTWFWWNLIRMFVLTISRLSSNMGHVRSKTRSPGQILGNSCLHPRGHICDPILMKLCQNVCFDNI